MSWISEIEGREISHSIGIRRIEDRIRKIEINKLQTENEVFLQALDYDVNLDPESQKNIRSEYTSPIPVGVQLRHFLPTRVLFIVNETERIARVIASAICERDLPIGLSDRVLLREMNYQIGIPLGVIRLLKDQLGNSASLILGSEENESISLPTLLERFSNLEKSQQKVIDQKIRKNRKLYEEIRKAVSDDLGENQQLSFVRGVSDLSDVNQYVDEFFASSIKYLGPLRDEPRPLYPLATSNDPVDIGIKGEHTAGVFDLNKDRITSYIPPDGFATPAVQPQVASRALKTAIIEWLKYLDVALDVQTHDLGKIGHELKVITNDTSKEQDLTHVGVGVSQVLPILVMCFLAEPDSTIVIEQPELHLHPKVQTLLADFFLSMALLGKQCIIETHSEYIINRLRFRAAAAQAEEISSLMKIYFVEKREGNSVFRPVEVNKYGAITDWPDGFFDQSQSEAEEILRAATLKRKAEKGK